MTEQTVRSVAKEIAACFYEESQRTPGFRQAFPTLQAFMRGQWHQNGDIVLNKPGWMYHIDLARKLFGAMLSQPDSRVSPIMKERIYEALIEEHERATSPQAKKVLQRNNQIH